MYTILITGATGNIGVETIKHLRQKTGDFRILAGIREKKRNAESQNPEVENIHFDFEDMQSVHHALGKCDVLFLLRPPQISDVEKYFGPLIEIGKNAGLKHIVFLSVQGVETSSMIPHHKIEKLILKSGISHTFLRPAYFMQNFTTTLRKDIIENQRIFLPAGNAKFTIVDSSDVGAVAAEVLTNRALHINKSYNLTNHEQLSFSEMAEILSQELDKKINFKSPNLLHFYWTKRKENVPSAFVLVMIMLHYLPRFKSTPPNSDWIRQIAKIKPRDFRSFVIANKDLLGGS